MCCKGSSMGSCRTSALSNCLPLEKRCLTIRRFLIPRKEKIMQPHFLLHLSLYTHILSITRPTVFFGSKSSSHKGDHRVSDVAQTGKCIFSCVFPWMLVFLFILKRACVCVCGRERGSLPWLHHYTMIHHSAPSSAESLVSPSAACFTDVMTSLALGTTSHTALWSLRWETQTKKVVWMSVPSWWLNVKRAGLHLDSNRVATVKQVITYSSLLLARCGPDHL